MIESRPRFEELLALRGQPLIDALVKHLVEMDRTIVDLQRELGALRDYQRTKQRWLATDSLINSPALLPRHVEIDATQLLPTGEGFFPVEYTNDGVGFRWTGPSPTFCFDIFVDRSAGAELELHVLGCVDVSSQLQSMALRVDEERVPVHLLNKDEGFVISAKIPGRQTRQSSHIEFFVHTMQAPGTHDTRLLGLKIVRLVVTAGERPYQSVASTEVPEGGSEKKRASLIVVAE